MIFIGTFFGYFEDLGRLWRVLDVFSMTLDDFGGKLYIYIYIYISSFFCVASDYLFILGPLWARAHGPEPGMGLGERSLTQAERLEQF